MAREDDDILCGNDVFGDPYPGVGKTCQCQRPRGIPPEREWPFLPVLVLVSVAVLVLVLPLDAVRS